jgi:hypothetical protein
MFARRAPTRTRVRAHTHTCGATSAQYYQRHLHVCAGAPVRIAATVQHVAATTACPARTPHGRYRWLSADAACTADAAHAAEAVDTLERAAELLGMVLRDLEMLSDEAHTGGGLGTLPGPATDQHAAMADQMQAVLRYCETEAEAISGWDGRRRGQVRQAIRAHAPYSCAQCPSSCHPPTGPWCCCCSLSLARVMSFVPTPFSGRHGLCTADCSVEAYRNRGTTARAGAAGLGEM